MASPRDAAAATPAPPPPTQPRPEQAHETAGQQLWRMLARDLMPALQHDILRRLPQDDTRALRLVCHEARALVDANVRVIHLRSLAWTQAAETQARAFSSFPNATTLLLRGGVCTDGMRHFLSYNAPLMRRITRIEADASTVLMSDTWRVILEACDPSILQVWAPCVANRRLRPFVEQVSWLASHAGGCGLTELDLSLSRVGDKELDLITRRCHKLKVLNLTSCAAVSDAGLRHCQRLLGLESLTLDKNMLTCEGLADLSSLQALTRLNLGWCRGMTPAGCRAAAALPNVRHLTITKHPETFPQLQALAAGRISGALHHLELTGCRFDQAAWQVCEETIVQLPALRLLDLSLSHVHQLGAALRALRDHRHGRLRLVTNHCTAIPTT